MARPRLDAPVPALNLSPALDGVVAQMGDAIGTRERMVLLTIDEIMKSGPSDFNARIVCERLGVKQSMVPYHFGNRDGLVVEATIWAYRDWSNHAIDVVRRTRGDGEKRLRGYITAECEWAARMGPLALLVQYPMLSEPVRIQLEARYGDEMRRKLEFHLAVLSDLVIDIRQKTTTVIDYDETNYPTHEKAIKNASEFLAATSISWASHGLAMWSSGNHLPSQSFLTRTIANISSKVAIANHIDQIVKIAQGR